jgi:hypothetical protein
MGVGLKTKRAFSGLDGEPFPAGGADPFQPFGVHESLDSPIPDLFRVFQKARSVMAGIPRLQIPKAGAGKFDAFRAAKESLGSRA